MTTHRESDIAGSHAQGIRGVEPVVAAFGDEWRALRDHPVPLAWQQACPELDGVTRLCELSAAVICDRIAAHLVIACQWGDRLAGRVLVQALLPRLSGLAARDARHELGDYVSTLWELLHDYPIERRHHAVSTNLLLDTRKRLSRAACREIVVEHPPEPPPPPVSSSRTRAAAAIDLATRRGMISPGNAAVLRSVYLDGLSGRQAAQRHAISEDLVRYRCSSSVKRMRLHAEELAS